MKSVLVAVLGAVVSGGCLCEPRPTAGGPSASTQDQCVAPLAGEAPEGAVLAALFPGWDRKEARAPLDGELVKDCFGHAGKTEWSGHREGPQRRPGQAIVKGRHEVDREHSFYFVATALESRACAAESGFLVYARVADGKAQILASNQWAAECGAPAFSLRPLKLSNETVYAERPGWTSSGAGKSEQEQVWILEPPSLEMRSFLLREDPDCPMGQGEESCQRVAGRLDVADGLLRHRVATTTKQCRTSNATTLCTPERTAVSFQRYRLQDRDLVEEPAAPDAHAPDFSRGYAGAVAARPVVGELLREGDAVSGGYSYSRKPTAGRPFDLVLDGVADGDRLSLKEFVAGGKKAGTTTGLFEGSLSPDGTFSGVFKSPDGTKTLPFEWRVTEARGVPGQFAFDIANVRLVSSAPPSGAVDPRGHESYAYDLLLLDRRRGFAVHTLERSRGILVHGACGPGRVAKAGTEFDDPSVLAAYKAAFPEDRVVLFDVFYDDCERAHGRLLALLVVERAGALRAVGRQVWSVEKNALSTEGAPVFDVGL